MESTFTKSIIRKMMRTKRRQLSLDFVSTASHTIIQKLITLPCFQKAHHIACYLSDENEVDTHLLIDIILQQQKSLYLPVFSDQKALAFYLINSTTQFQKNTVGIDEPIVSQQAPVSPEQLELIILPLVAFDKAGNRIGRGAGAYDRYVACKKTTDLPHPTLIGLAYAFQRIEKVPSDEWDVALDTVITEV